MGIITEENVLYCKRVMKCLWFDHYFGERKVLTTLACEQLKVKKPGWWNLEEGPDFKKAVILIGNERFEGSIAVDLLSSDWVKSGKDKAEAYKDVVLYVVGCHDIGGPFVQNCFRKNIHILCLGMNASKEIEAILGPILEFLKEKGDETASK